MLEGSLGVNVNRRRPQHEEDRSGDGLINERASWDGHMCSSAMGSADLHMCFRRHGG